ncbi:MAG: hypothetical protein NZ930_07310, partial [Candidatus Bipolaricaulota bacterium]|nr:hypothetical protein [Candidatus Bipolaricaulota bacterium]
MKKLFFTISLSFLCALALLSVSPYGLRAAPISGSFSTEVVFYPQHGISREGEDPASKVDLVDVKFEADLILTFSISGLEVTSTTAFTFRGVEFQSFVLDFTLGALTLRNTTIFAPTFFEFEELRDQFGRLRWCLLTAPVPLTQEACNTPDLSSLPLSGGLYAHILDPDFGILPWHRFFGANAIHTVAQNLALARWVEALSARFAAICRVFFIPHLLELPVQFQRNIVDASLKLGELYLGARMLFANFNILRIINFIDRVLCSFVDFSASGIIAYLEGQTVSGVLVRGELWLGAKQGLACFGECKPLERFYNAMVTGGGLQNPEEEKLFIKNLVIAGVRHDLLAEFHFDLTNYGPEDGPNRFQCMIDQLDNDNDGWFAEDPQNNTDDDNDGFIDEDDWDVTSVLCFVQVRQSGRLAPWGLNFQLTWNFNGQLDLLSTVGITELRIGEITAQSTWVFWSSVQQSFTEGLSRLALSFDPPGVKLSLSAIFCTNATLCRRPTIHQSFVLPPVAR